jgi:hypothetical protein
MSSNYWNNHPNNGETGPLTWNKLFDDASGENSFAVIAIVSLTVREKSLRRPRGMTEFSHCDHRARFDDRWWEAPAKRNSAHRLGTNERSAMKLNSAQLERTLGQFEARAIPDDHPVIPQLSDLFGEHTFLLDSHGLNIVEPVEAGESAMVVNLAHWSDDSRSDLELHEPEATDVVIMLGLKH